MLKEDALVQYDEVDALLSQFIINCSGKGFVAYFSDNGAIDVHNTHFSDILTATDTLVKRFTVFTFYLRITTLVGKILRCA